jgi:hypothetical protein
VWRHADLDAWRGGLEKIDGIEIQYEFIGGERMITPTDFEAKIMQYLRLHSGLEVRRSYLGISQVVKCPRLAYRGFTEGTDLDDYHHRMCYAGYLFERDVLQRMREMRIAVLPGLNRREVVAPDDDRLRGHIDGLTAWGDLLEIKSVTTSKFALVCQQDRALHEHNDQVQLYMRYGGWKFCWMVYVCRETLEHKVIRVRYDEVKAKILEQKALLILAAIDRGEMPKCECGYCESE